MPTLIRYRIVRLAIGFAVGGTSALALILLVPNSVGSPSSWLEIALIIYGFGSVFALGYLATALASEV